jgi:ketosteroid isomerase-like protein
MKLNVFAGLLCLLSFAVLGSCNQSDTPGNNSGVEQADLQKQEEEVKFTLAAMWEAIENEDIELYASYVHPDFTQFGESDPVLKIGKKAEVDGIREWLKNSSDIHTEMEEPLVVIRDSVAWITYYWKDRGYSNGEAFSSRGKSTRIFVKENGNWLCIHAHYTLLQ